MAHEIATTSKNKVSQWRIGLMRSSRLRKRSPRMTVLSYSR